MPRFANFPCRFFAPSLRLALSLIALAGLIPAARAQVTFTGATASQNLGSQAVGSPATAASFPFSIAAGTTVGSIGLLTQGAPNLDFTSAAGTTCTPTTYSATTACSVNLTFTPQTAGLRLGAIVFFSGVANTGTVLGKVLIYGQGSQTGPEIAFNPAATVAISPTVDGVPVGELSGVAVDGSGNLFITDGWGVLFNNGGHDRVVEVPAGGGAPSVVGTGVSGYTAYIPTGLAVDGAGDLFIANWVHYSDVNYGYLEEVPIGGGPATALDSGASGSRLGAPESEAIDVTGNIFVADRGTDCIVEIGADITPGSDFICGVVYPAGVAVDEAGDLFIANGLDNVSEEPAGGGAATNLGPVVNGSGLNQPEYVTLDGLGDLFIADSGNNRVIEVPAGGGAPIAISPVVNGLGLGWPSGLSLDSAGNLFISDQFNNRVLKVQRSQATPVNFSIPTTVASTDTTDGTQTIQIQNSGNAPLTFTEITYPADFPQASGDANACTTSTSVPPGQFCDLPIQFTPQNLGSLNEEVTFSANALNVTGAQQAIPVSGIGVSATQPTLFAPVPGSTLTSSTQTFTWNPGSGPSEFQLRVGTSALGSENIFNGPVTTSTSVTVPNIPTNGLPVYVLLNYKVGNVWSNIGYTYNEAAPTPPSMTSPSGTAPLAGSTQTFVWNPGAGSVSFGLRVGTIGPGSSDVYDSGATTATSVTVSNIPGTAKSLFVTLSYKLLSGWNHINYTYTMAPTPPSMISPLTTAPLPGSTVTFTWSPGFGADEFALLVGDQSIKGSQDIYASGATTSTSETVSNIPTSGQPIYVTLLYRTNGTWNHISYQYLAYWAPPAMTSPSTTVPLTGSTQTFTWNPGSGVGCCTVRVGTTGPGSTDIYSGGPTGTNSVTVSNIPTNVLPLFVTLTYTVYTSTYHITYTYTEAGTPTPPSMTSPTPSSALTGSTQTFTWNPGVGQDNFTLRVGTIGPGSMDVYNGPPTGATSALVTNIPTKGLPLFVTLSYGVLGNWSHINYTYTEAALPMPPSMTAPTPSSALTGSTQTFTWDRGYGNRAFALRVGTSPGSSDIYEDAYTLDNSVSVSNIPTLGLPVYATLSYKQGATWNQISYTYTEAPSTLPSMTSPANSSTLAGSSQTFTWSPGSGPTEFALKVGTNGVGSSDLYNGTATTNTSATVSSIPTNGAPLYVMLSYKLNGAWSEIDYTYTEAGSPTLPSMISPAPPGPLTGTSQTFTWSPGSGPTEFALWLGTNGPGSKDVYLGPVTTSTSATVSNIPANSRPVYVTLAYKLRNVWNYIAYTYAAAAPIPPSMTSPAPSSVLTSSTQTFTWDSGIGATEFALWVGTIAPGSRDLYHGMATTSTTATVSNIPTLAAPLYVTLAYKLNGDWNYVNYTYTEAPPGRPSMTSPAPSSVLTGSTQTFSWDPGSGPTEFALRVGTTAPGSLDIYNGPATTSTSVTVANIPTLSNPVYVTLTYRANNVWSYINYTYTEASPTPPSMTSPAPSSVLTGSTQTFSWNPGSGPTEFALQVGTTGVGSSDVYNGAPTTTTSATVSGIPKNGLPLYVALSYQLQGAWSSINYTYTDAPPPPLAFTGTAASQNLGSQAIGSPGAAVSFPFSIPAGGFVGSIAVLTQGAPNLDFTSAAGTTCAAQSYSSTTACNVNVTFTPTAAGSRTGAVVFFAGPNNTGTVLASVPIYGIGTGPQITYTPARTTAISPTVAGLAVGAVSGVAVDGAGDLFITDGEGLLFPDNGHDRVVEVPAGGGTPVVVGTGVSGYQVALPTGLAVDGAGDLLIADWHYGSNSGYVEELPIGGGVASSITGPATPESLAVNGMGDIFIADRNNSTIEELPPGGGPSIGSFYDPYAAGVAVDGSGNVFMANGVNSAFEAPAGGGSYITIDPTVDGSALYEPEYVAVDGVGNLYIVDCGNNRIVEVPVGGGAPFAIDPIVNGLGLNFPSGLVANAAGDLFISDEFNNRVLDVQRSQAPAIGFATATPVGSTDTTEGTQTVQVQNSGNTALTFSALAYPADFSAASGDANACTASTVLLPGQSCDLPIQFTPQNTGTLTEAVTFTANTLNVPGTQQSISVTGTGLAPSAVKTIAPARQ